MKKYLLGIVAIVLAIGLSAFGTSHQANDKGLTSYVWYLTTYNDDFPSGAILSSGDVRFGGAMQTQTYADANDGCSGTVKHCFRGYPNSLSSFPSTAAPASTTTKN